MGTTDGMNEKGFSGNMLWLAERVWQAGRGTPRTVHRPVAPVLPGQFHHGERGGSVFSSPRCPDPWASAGDSFKKPLTVHLALGDKTGDSAVIEYVGSKAKIFTGFKPV